MSIEAKSTHAVEAKARLLHALQELPRLERLVEAFASRTQSEEIVAQQLRTMRWLANSTGAQLDGIGEIVGQPRRGKSDEDYRVYLAVRILMNRSSGTVDQLLAIANLVVGDGRTRIERYRPAAMVARIRDATTQELAGRLANIISVARAAGVQTTVEYSAADDADTFTFASGDTAEYDKKAGFGSGRKTVAVGSHIGPEACLITSSDDETWTQQPTFLFGTLHDVGTDSNGNALAVGGAEFHYTHVLVSRDGGSSWRQRTPRLYPSTSLFGVCWCENLGLWIAVGRGPVPGAVVITSPDGNGWMGHDAVVNETLRSVAFGSGVVIAVGDTDGTDAAILRSTNGVVWAETPNPKSADLRSVCYGNGRFVAVGLSDGSDSYIVTSSNGKHWTEQEAPKNVALNDVVWSEDLNQFVAVGEADTDSFVATSADGIAWTEQSTPTTGTLFGICVGTERALVAVGEFGTGGQIITSDDGASWTEQSRLPAAALNACVGCSSPGGVWAAVEEA
jgi:hypothetical protein